jgi:hypothetical protein
MTNLLTKREFDQMVFLIHLHDLISMYASLLMQIILGQNQITKIHNFLYICTTTIVTKIFELIEREQVEYP